MKNNCIMFGKKKGNVLILVILVMLTAAMLGLLTLSFLKEMFFYTSNLEGYYKSYYLSKAGLELGLVEINNSSVGFSNIISGDDNIFTQNLCSGYDNCSVVMYEKGRSNMLSMNLGDSICTNDNAFVLNTGESFILPLFYQTGVLLNSDIVNGFYSGVFSYLKLDDIKKIKFDIKSGVNGTINMNLIGGDNLFPIQSGNFEQNVISYYLWRGISFENTGYYFVITNVSSDVMSFCVTGDVEIPFMNYLVMSVGNYQGKYVGLQAIYNNPVASFMLN